MQPSCACGWNSCIERICKRGRNYGHMETNGRCDQLRAATFDKHTDAADSPNWDGSKPTARNLALATRSDLRCKSNPRSSSPCLRPQHMAQQAMRPRWEHLAGATQTGSKCKDILRNCLTIALGTQRACKGMSAARNQICQTEFEHGASISRTHGA